MRSPLALSSPVAPRRSPADRAAARPPGRRASQPSRGARLATGLVVGALVGPLAGPVPGGAPARAEPLVEAGLGLGWGLALGGGAGQMTTKLTALTLQATGSIAIEEDPRLAGFGGLVVETLGRSAVGGMLGARLHPGAGQLRLAGGATILAAPYTLYGAFASGGTCTGGKAIRYCGDLQLTSFFAGSDLADGHTVTQVQLVAGAVFDAL